MSRREHSRELWKGALAGLAGGLAGAWAMNQFQLAWTKLSKASGQQRGQENSQQPETDEDATMRTADRLLRPVLGRELTRREKKIGGPIVHYAFGGSMGAVYGTLGELWPFVRVGAGTGFGSALFVGADEIAVPLFGLGGSPRRTPLKLHAYALASHIVYGLTTEMTRCGARALLSRATKHLRPRLVHGGRTRRSRAAQERRSA
ncbi:MAG TPA: DUF1440 domain-containing protein [Candidatus Acidoferrales bacterium]|nr:DUF1440 domain-containing protein [Candidatus Acidoferrales bacterium]